MNFRVNIKCDNDSFATDRNEEVANILELLAARVRRGDVDNAIGRTQYRTLWDTNGNNVGHATYDRTGESGY
jgi:hypothetical protein